MQKTIVALALAAVAAPALAQEGEVPGAGNSRDARRSPVVVAVEKAAPAVVSIGTTKIVKFRYFDWGLLGERKGEEQQHGLGSGVIVHPAGYVITNAHVINQADRILVKLTGARENEPEIPATLIATDLAHDLALVRLEKPGRYPYVDFGRSDDLMLGETVIAIGNPFGLGRTVTTGIISALDRSISAGDASFTGLIQTDAAVNRGNSGGPLVNINGEWIGVNSAIYSLSGGADGISFAIPAGVVRRFVVDSLRAARFSGVWLGLVFGDDGKGGLVVERVHPVGPAAKAGIEAGSRVVLEGDALRFCFELLDAAATGAFSFDVRDASDVTKRHSLRFEAPPTEELAWTRMGVKCAEVDDAISERTGYRPGAGLVVLEVRDGGPAQRNQIERGDLLVSLGEARLATLDGLLDVVLLPGKDETRELRFVRPKRTRFGTTYENWRARIVLE